MSDTESSNSLEAIQALSKEEMKARMEASAARIRARFADAEFQRASANFLSEGQLCRGRNAFLRRLGGGRFRVRVGRLRRDGARGALRAHQPD